MHYFDLTEDVPTTSRVMRAGRRGPQDGIRPAVRARAGPDRHRRGVAGPAVRVDPQHRAEGRRAARGTRPGLLGYAFNWSAEGVVNEYLNDCEVLRGGVRQMVPAMTEHERVVIGGIELEASLTSGGLGTMCETFEGRVQRLDYKTMRYPGHFELMRFFFDELGLRDRRELAGEILVNAKPPVDDDVVYLHAAVEGIAVGRRRHRAGAADPQAVRPRLPAAGDQRPDLAGHLMDDGGLGRRGRRTGRRRPAARRRVHPAGEHPRSTTCWTTTQRRPLRRARRV